MKFVEKVFLFLKVEVAVHLSRIGLRFMLAAFMGPANYGIFVLLKLIPDYSEKLGRLAVDDAAIYLAGKKEYPVKEVAFTLFFLILLMSLLFVIILLWQSEQIGQWIFKDLTIDKLLLWIIIISIPPIFLIRSMLKLFLFHDSLLIYNCLAFLPSLLGLLIGSIAFIVFDAGIIGLFICFGVIYFIALLIGMFFYLKNFGVTPVFKPVLVARLFGYGGRLYLATLANFIKNRVDILIVAYFLTSKEVGYYALALLVITSFSRIPAVASMLIYPLLTKRKHGEAVKMTVKACRHVFFIGLIFCVPIFFVVKILVASFMPKDYSLVPGIVLLALPGVIFTGIIPLLQSHFFGTGRPSIITKAVLYSGIVSLAGNFLLIPKIGLLGAPVSFSISSIFMTVLILVRFLQVEGVKLKEIFAFKKDDLSLYLKLFKLQK